VSLAEREMLARLGGLRGRLGGMAEVLIAFPLGFLAHFVITRRIQKRGRQAGKSEESMN